MAAEPLPLFPLNTVLFPGGRLPLRIFEPRYLDLVRDCARAGSGFGVCLILAGREVGEPAVPVAIGCGARIVDFNQGDDGLLGIVVQGTRRFHVEHSQARDNGLLVAEVEWLPEPPAQRIRPEHELLALLLRRLCDQAGMRVEEAQFEDAHWVAWRLAEWLPVSLGERQQLLQEDDGHRRLQQLLECIPQFQAE